MGAGISAMALLSAAAAHGCRSVAGDNQSFRVRAGVIRGALLSLDGSAAGVHLSGCAVIRAGSNWRQASRRLLIIGVSEVGDLSRYGLSYGAYVRRGSGPIHATDVLQPADAGAGTRQLLAQHWQAENSVSLLIAATALSHVVFGYAAIVSVAIMALVGPRGDRSRRVVRAASILIPTFILARMVRRSDAAGQRRSEPVPMGRRVEVRFVGRAEHIERHWSRAAFSTKVDCR